MKLNYNTDKCFQITIIVVFIFSLFVSCKKEVKLETPLGLEELRLNIPEDNPLTEEKVELGRKLFFDERLSIDGTVSCSFCHNPLAGFGDGKYLAMGVYGLKGTRNTPTLLNRGYGKSFNWDGRANSLEEQLLAHITNPDEMKNSPENVIRTLNESEEYREEFKKVFNTAITMDGIAKSIASFERTLISGNSNYDKFRSGDINAISKSAKRGYELFFSNRFKCSTCHSGPNFTDENYHNLGIGMDEKKPDLGRFNYTNKSEDKGRFKTPSLRNLSRTSPYMHNGKVKSLMDAVNILDNGGIPNDNLSNIIKPLNLTQSEKEDLVEFLRTLNGTNILSLNMKKLLTAK